MKKHVDPIQHDAGMRSKHALHARDKRAFAKRLIAQGESMRKRICAAIAAGLALVGIAALLG